MTQVFFKLTAVRLNMTGVILNVTAVILRRTRVSRRMTPASSALRLVASYRFSVTSPTRLKPAALRIVSTSETRS